MAIGDFILNSDYPIDKIIGYRTGSIVIPSFGFNDVTISHGFSSAPLYYLRWSYSSTFDESFDETGGGAGYDVFVSCVTDSQNITIRTDNNISSSRTIYYRVILFSRYDATFEATNTQSGLDDFNINTDYNYPKIYLEGYLNNPTDTVNHNLGYTPTVEAWSVSTTGTFTHYNGSDMTGTSYRLLVSNTSLTFISDNPMVTFRIYYRIYLDGV